MRIVGEDSIGENVYAPDLEEGKIDEKMTAIERLEVLLSVMDATQGENSEYSRDIRLGIDRIKELEGG